MYLNPIKSSGVYGSFGNFCSGVKKTKVPDGEIKYPSANIMGNCVKYSDVVDFHKNIATRKDRDKISYDFYTTPLDFGSGRSILLLPSQAGNSKETLQEMKKEFDRLISDESKLSSKEKLFIEYLDQGVSNKIRRIEYRYAAALGVNCKK